MIINGTNFGPVGLSVVAGFGPYLASDCTVTTATTVCVLALRPVDGGGADVCVCGITQSSEEAHTHLVIKVFIRADA